MNNPQMKFFYWTETGTEEDTGVIHGTPEDLQVLEEEEGRTDLHTGRITDLIHHGQISKMDSLVRPVSSLQGSQERLRYPMMSPTSWTHDPEK